MKDYKFLLYVKESCPFCQRAKDLLQKSEINFKYINFEDNLKIVDQLKDAFNWSTVPMVFSKKENVYEFVGGFSDLRERLENHG